MHVGLILSRKLNEQIELTVGEEKIVVTVVMLLHDKVRLGFSAGPNVTIMRSELLRKDEA